MRPYLLPKDFIENEAFTRDVIRHLKYQYLYYLAGNNSKVIQSLKIEREVFDVVKETIGTVEPMQANIIESVFDTFLGALSMFGNTQEIFDFLDVALFIKIDHEIWGI